MRSSRTYSEAIALLNTCQSNAATIEAIRKSGGRMNDFAIPEMHDYLRRIGYTPTAEGPEQVERGACYRYEGQGIYIGFHREDSPSPSAWKDRFVASYMIQTPQDVEVRIGLYTSPHICAVRERIRINGEPLSEEEFAKYFFEVWERLEADPKTMTPLTPVFPIYFRLLTLLSFHTFLSLGVEATILEVGIGGTYDSTNIVPAPVVTGVSSLGIDHTAVLGNTIEEIARNKAGIYKAGVPALSVRQDYPTGEAVLAKYAKEIGAEFRVVENLPADIDLKLGLPGKHQKVNAALAIELSRVFLSIHSPSAVPSASSGEIPESFKEPLALTRWPGRCQTIPQPEKNTTWYLDGAHTVESLKSCGEWIFAGETLPNTLIFNCSGGRSGETLMKALLESTGEKAEVVGKRFETVIFCTNVTYSDGGFKGDLASNAIDPNDLAALTTQHALKESWLSVNPSFDAKHAHVVASIQDAVSIIDELSKRDKVDVLVAGSLHLVGGVMEVAGLQEGLSMT
ncbi:folylpolyglutamate synthase, partial [Tremellales sp. Uapishka_1]